MACACARGLQHRGQPHRRRGAQHLPQHAALPNAGRRREVAVVGVGDWNLEPAAGESPPRRTARDRAHADAGVENVASFHLRPLVLADALDVDHHCRVDMNWVGGCCFDPQREADGGERAAAGQHNRRGSRGRRRSASWSAPLGTWLGRLFALAQPPRAQHDVGMRDRRRRGHQLPGERLDLRHQHRKPTFQPVLSARRVYHRSDPRGFLASGTSQAFALAPDL